MIEMLGIEDKSTKLKYLRLIQRMDDVERAFHAEELKKANKGKT